MTFTAAVTRRVLYEDNEAGFLYPIGNTPAKAVLPAGQDLPTDCKVNLSRATLWPFLLQPWHFSIRCCSLLRVLTPQGVACKPGSVEFLCMQHHPMVHHPPTVTLRLDTADDSLVGCSSCSGTPTRLR